ncbi:MAG: Chloramphenicol phosphotransferase family protein [Clostridia bacterium]|nr:Chloramphenicol phosphotransferase family protein [Clostridia bacterium]
MQKGKIIFLNGVSGAGKSTLIKTLQERLTEPFYSIKLDNFIYMSPEKYFTDPNGRITVNKAVSMMPYTIRTFSDMGINTIVEHVFLKIDNLMEECVELLHEYPVLFVHVTCPSEELRRREKERGYRPGVSEEQLTILKPQDTYDITVNTYSNTKEECADKIIELSDHPKNFMAFKTLWSQRIN